MTTNSLPDPAARRAYRQQLRAVARLLRGAGIALVLLGTAGIALGGADDWFVVPSWVSFGIGWVLVLCGVVRRVDAARLDADD